MAESLRGLWLGRRRYEPVYALQDELRKLRTEGRTGDVVLLLEHEPVITLGRGAKAANLLVSGTVLRTRGVEVVTTDRGGDVTLHAPGQLVAYPIIDLRPDRCDVRRYVRDLTEVMRLVASRHGIAAGPVEGYVGLWVDAARPGSPPEWAAPATHEPGSPPVGRRPQTRPGLFEGKDRAERLQKLGAIGVRISRWVTMHGFALNLTTDLSLFDLIVPCGIAEHAVTSIEALTGTRPSPASEAPAALGALAKTFGAHESVLEDWSGRELGPLLEHS